LLTVVQAHPLLVEFVLTEKDAELLSNDRSDFELISLQSQEMIGGGKITFMDNLYDCRTGLLLVRGSASNREGALRPGRTVRVRIPVSQIAAAKIIPQKAVKYNQEGPYLYVIGEADVVEMRKIVLGPVQGNDIIVAEGLLAHEQVITDGHMRIYPGAKVEVRE
jgi:multidrug efflux system membrane fusion protein